MTFTASQIALLVNGNIEGDINASVNNFGKIEIAKTGELTFLSNPKYNPQLPANSFVRRYNVSFRQIL